MNISSISDSVEMLPVIFITSFESTAWRRSAKNRSRSSLMNETMTLNSSLSDNVSTD